MLAKDRVKMGSEFCIIDIEHFYIDKQRSKAMKEYVVKVKWNSREKIIYFSFDGWMKRKVYGCLLWRVMAAFSWNIENSLVSPNLQNIASWCPKYSYKLIENSLIRDICPFTRMRHNFYGHFIHYEYLLQIHQNWFKQPLWN